MRATECLVRVCRIRGRRVRRQQPLNVGRIQPPVGPVLAAVIKAADIKLDVQVGQSADPPDSSQLLGLKYPRPNSSKPIL